MYAECFLRAGFLVVLSKIGDFVRTLRRLKAAEPQRGSGGRRPPDFFLVILTQQSYITPERYLLY